MLSERVNLRVGVLCRKGLIHVELLDVGDLNLSNRDRTYFCHSPVLELSCAALDITKCGSPCHRGPLAKHLHQDEYVSPSSA